jgi:hypothetical protein
MVTKMAGISNLTYIIRGARGEKEDQLAAGLSLTDYLHG